MARVVALPKAAAAGAAGALTMEAVALAISAAGWPAIDFARQLAAVIDGPSPAVALAAGVGSHILVGILWAVFYGHTFWGRFKWPPPIQGLAFAAVPAILAAFVVYPQLELMRLDTDVATIGLREAIAPMPLAAALSLVLAHAAFGLVMGALYTRPVGYRSDRKPDRPLARRSLPHRPSRRNEGSRAFIFATGIEGSYPTIDHGRWRRDEMESTGHYRHWQRDFELAREIGATHIRYGPPLPLVFSAPGRFDWTYSDQQMNELRDHGPEPIADLCHFGLPSWLGNFQNAEIVDALAEYAAAFADRYPWVRFYTPVNEMYVCARFSALEGLWNEQLSDDAAFVNAAVNLATSSIRMSDAILKSRPDAVFINSESSEFYQPCCPDPDVEQFASFENERRFLPLDLIYAHPVSDRMRAHLLDHGIGADVLGAFGGREVPRRSILGVDYYEWNERLVDRGGQARALGELFGWYVIADQYYRRYGRPMMHTETNRSEADDAPRWLWRQWHNVQLLRNTGVPLVGFTWYSLVDQIDWRIALTESLGLIDPVGLFDLNREPRGVGLAYKHLISLYRDQPGYRECPALAEVMR